MWSLPVMDFPLTNNTFSRNLILATLTSSCSSYLRAIVSRLHIILKVVELEWIHTTGLFLASLHPAKYCLDLNCPCNISGGVGRVDIISICARVSLYIYQYADAIIRANIDQFMPTCLRVHSHYRNRLIVQSLTVIGWHEGSPLPMAHRNGLPDSES